jgi:hypothetical protein
MPAPRDHAGVAAVNGKLIHVVGGGRMLGTAGTNANEAFKPD